MKRKGSTITTVILVLLFVIGLSLLLYPALSDYWNSLHQSAAISDYAENVADLSKENYNELWTAAKNYNASLVPRFNAFLLTDEQKEQYDSLLNVSGLGIMGYIEIPR